LDPHEAKHGELALMAATVLMDAGDDAVRKA